MSLGARTPKQEEYWQLETTSSLQTFVVQRRSTCKERQFSRWLDPKAQDSCLSV